MDYLLEAIIGSLAGLAVVYPEHATTISAVSSIVFGAWLGNQLAEINRDY